MLDQLPKTDQTTTPMPSTPRKEWLDQLYPGNPNRQQCCEALLRLYVVGAVRPEDIRRNDLLTKCVAYIDPPDIHALRAAFIRPNAQDQRRV